jgi:outer membrane immunogenic protein
MRRVICALLVLLLPASARAGDFDILRGSVPTYHWGGFYGGAQGGFTSSDMNFGNAASAPLAFLLRDSVIEQDEQVSTWTVLETRRPAGASFGGFVGYNLEWEDVVLGVEVNYNHMFLSASSQNSISRTFTDSNNLPPGHDYFYDVTVGGKAAMQLTDVATFRGRAGLEAGIFLPYAFAGVALGRVNTSVEANFQESAVDFPASETPPLTPLPNISVGPVDTGSAQNNALAYGIAAGVGVDVALLPNVFVRGEFEYIYFAPVNGIQVTLSTARLGAGLKF